MITDLKVYISQRYTEPDLSHNEGAYTNVSLSTLLLSLGKLWCRVTRAHHFLHIQTYTSPLLRLLAAQSESLLCSTVTVLSLKII